MMKLNEDNEDKKKKYIEKRQVVLDSAFKLYKILPEIFTDQFDKLKHNKKKKPLKTSLKT